MLDDLRRSKSAIIAFLVAALVGLCVIVYSLLNTGKVSEDVHVSKTSKSDSLLVLYRDSVAMKTREVDSVVSHFKSVRDSLVNFYESSVDTEWERTVHPDGTLVERGSSHAKNKSSSTSVSTTVDTGSVKLRIRDSVVIKVVERDSIVVRHETHYDSSKVTTYGTGEAILGITHISTVDNPFSIPMITAGGRVHFGQYVGIGGYVDANAKNLAKSGVRLEAYLRLGF